MWGGGQGNHSSPTESFNRSLNGSNGDSSDASQVAAAAALAARMAYATAYDIGAPMAPTASSSYYDIYGGQPEQDDAAILFAQHQRARDLEFFHLQQQMQERQAIENEARSRLLEHAARNQIHEFERSRREMALLAEIQQRDQEARFEVERSRLVHSEAVKANALRSRPEIDVDAAHILQEQQLTEYLTSQKDQSLGHESGNSQQWTSPDKSELSAVELKDDRSPSVAVAEKLEPKGSPPPNKNASFKQGQSPKKDQPLEKELSIKDDPLLVNVRSPQKISASNEEAKVSVDTPLSSFLGVEVKNSPALTKSPPASKKRKSTPSKSSGASAATGSKAKQAKKSPGSSVGGKATPSPSNNLSLSLPLKRKSGTPSLDDTAPGITEAQYENVEALMKVFCKVPLLAEFSRPVVLLHPEVRNISSMNLYDNASKKIVSLYMILSPQ